MEGHCSTGQSPQWTVMPMEEEEQQQDEEEEGEDHLGDLIIEGKRLTL